MRSLLLPLFLTVSLCASGGMVSAQGKEQKPAIAVEKILALQPASLRVVVPASWADSNGHMNMRWYVAIFDDAGNVVQLRKLSEAGGEERRSAGVGTEVSGKEANIAEIYAACGAAVVPQRQDAAERVGGVTQTRML